MNQIKIKSLDLLIFYLPLIMEIEYISDFKKSTEY